ncbi:YARHG domain-containing protein [Sebaldella sp. S0638]|uniref:YARHG domain-containing protein n=1 Tax=Sebaldella sp. S0638 TaxID=2957809 RepID=UPI00209EEA5F|nr:YARHG domain-containing protein [Sebaldella sp. S0638]MCP1223763.1 YARHG domain-containing protein [Sebaldella sp. S0638]
MKKVITASICIMVLLFTSAFSAEEIYWGGEDLEGVTLKDFRKDTVSDISKYKGEYHFGESEGESTLKIIVTPAGKVYAQLYWAEYNVKKNKWDLIVDNYNNVKIEGNKIVVSGMNAEFMIYTKENVRGVLETVTENGKKSYEFGNYSGELYMPGKYPEMSTREITKEELSKKSKEELKIMRNEVYARYNMSFKKGGDMDKYFSKQDWYYSNVENAEKFLSQLEKDNIKLVLEIEKQK